MKTVIIIPTYDEKDNVRPIAEAVFKNLPDTHILFVDDNSPDGTGDILDAMSAENSAIQVLHNEKKNGLGRAYIGGFKWALKNSYDLIFEMDADFSHDPIELPNFVKAAKNADLVLGSRYVDGIRITNWPISRLILSKSASLYVRFITGIPTTDPTGGYKCYSRKVLETIDLDAIVANGYSFQVEISYKAWMHGFTLRDIPITFVDRRAGYSKMSGGIFKEAIWLVLKLALKNNFRRKPLKKQP